MSQLILELFIETILVYLQREQKVFFSFQADMVDHKQWFILLMNVDK